MASKLYRTRGSALRDRSPMPTCGRIRQLQKLIDLNLSGGDRPGPTLPSDQLHAEHQAHTRKTESMISVDRARQSRLSLGGILSASEPPGVRYGPSERGNDTASGN